MSGRNYFLKKVSATLRDACLLAIEPSRRVISSFRRTMRSCSSFTDKSANSCPISCVIFFLGRSSSSSFIFSLRLCVLRLALAQSESGQPRQHLVTEERQLVQIVDERNADPCHACIAQVGERPGDVVGVADDRQATHAVGIEAALPLEFLAAF